MFEPRYSPRNPRTGSKTIVVGHRGDPSRFPENSIAAILGAGDFAAMAEIDVRRTADGEMALSHEAHHGETLLIETVWAEISTLDLGRGHQIARFTDLLADIGDFPLNVEIKNWPIDPDFDPSFAFALKVAQRARFTDLITCFHWPTMHAIKRDLPDQWTGLLVDEAWDLAYAVDEANQHAHQALALHHSLIADQPESVMQLVGSLEVYVWTVDDIDLGIRLADANVDGLITNDPEAMARALRGESE